MDNLHLIEVNYYGPTNHQGSRVRLKSHRFKHSIFLSYDYSIGDILAQAEEYLSSHGHHVAAHCETIHGYGVLCRASETNLFMPLK